MSFYIAFSGDLSIESSLDMIVSYLDRRVLPFLTDFLMQTHITSILIMLMRTKRDIFSSFDVEISDPILNPTWHFSMTSNRTTVKECNSWYSLFCEQNTTLNWKERNASRIAFYRMIESAYVFKYKDLQMFTVTIAEPEQTCEVLDKVISRITIEANGKHNCWYFIGDLYAIMYKDLFAHIIEVAWHPDRCFKWCFAHDNETINYVKYEQEAKAKIYEIEVLNRKLSMLKM